MRVAYTAAAPETRTDRVLAWRGALAVTFPALAEMGYDGVELMVRGPEEIDGQAVRSLALRHGLSIPVIGTGPIGLERGITLSAVDENERQEAVSAAQSALRLCHVLGAVLNIGQLRGRCEPDEIASVKSRFADSLRQLVPMSEQLNVRIALEPQNRFQSSYLRTARETLDILERIGSDRFGLVLDTFHMNIEENSFDEPIKLAPERVFHVHFSDNHRGAPGTGMIPFDRVKQSLDDILYSGWISVEIRQSPTPREAAEAGLRGVRRIYPSG